MSAQDKMVKSIAKLGKVRNTIAVEGKDVLIYACQVRHIPVLVGATKALMVSLKVTTMQDAVEQATSLEQRMRNPQIALQLISELSDHATDLVYAMSSMEKDEFNALELDGATLILKEIYEVNKDFFTKKLLPLLQPMLNLSSEGTEEPEAALTTAPVETSNP